MSMHKIPLTDTEREGLQTHSLDIGTASQLSDAFRQGVSWGERTSHSVAHKELLEIHHIGMCIAECPPISDKDSMTVRMVKEMAIRINQWKL